MSAAGPAVFGESTSAPRPLAAADPAARRRRRPIDDQVVEDDPRRLGLVPVELVSARSAAGRQVGAKDRSEPVDLGSTWTLFTEENETSPRRRGIGRLRPGLHPRLAILLR